MAFRLPRLPSVEPVWNQFQLWWQRVVEKIEEQETLQDETINRIRRILSHTEPTSIFTATDDGNLTIADHIRLYADGTSVSITGTTLTGLDPETWYGVYYDDETLSDTTPTFIHTTNLAACPAAKAEGRHFCGFILTPATGSGDIIETGGTYSAGSGTVAGEVSEDEDIP